MRIGIYKPGKTIYFFENEEDHASWSYEVTQIAKIFAAHGDQVFILSKTDYDESIENITAKETHGVDKIFVFNGVFENENKLIAQLQCICKDINLIVTDLALLPKRMNIFKNIYSQSKNFHTYAAIEQNVLFNYQPHNPITQKTLYYYFGGTERGRLADIIEYIWRPACQWFGKSEFFKFKNYIPYHKHLEKLEKAFSTIVIGDEAYNQIGFVTPRYYEAIKYDVIAFVDNKFDPDCLILQKDDWCRVSSYQELYNKQRILKENKEAYNKIIALQHSRITQDIISGNNIYNLLTR